MKLKLFISALAAAGFALGNLPSAGAQSTLSTTNHYAWDSNTGWLDCRPERPGAGDGVRVTDTHLGGYAWSPNLGWINLGNNAPANQLRYANDNNSDFGVNQDGAGNLSGLAWAPNIGWINFGWADSTNVNRPRFNLLTGQFAGYAWSANSGWVNLGSGQLQTTSIATVDSDGDGLSDAWELEHAGNLTTLSANGDADHDGQTDLAEYLAGTDPLAADDGLQVVNISRYVALLKQYTRVEWTSQPTRVYTLWESTNLTANAWSIRGTYVGAPDTTVGNVVGNLPQAFYRVEVKLPLQP